MGFIRRLLGRDETAAEPTKSRQQAGLAEAIDKRRAGTEAVVVRLMPDLAEWDVPDDGEEDIWWRGHHLHDEKGIGWRQDDPALVRAGLVITKIAGYQHHDGLPLDGAAPGRSLVIIAEPDNPYDPNAIGIWVADGKNQIGYLPRDVAAQVAPRIRKGEQLRAMCLAEIFKRPSEERVGIRVLLAPAGAVEGWPEEST